MKKTPTQEFYFQTAVAVANYLGQELNIYPHFHYQVLKAISGPRVLCLNFQINPTHASSIISMASQLSMAAGLDGNTTIRIARGSGGTLRLEVPKPEALWFNVDIEHLPQPGRLRLRFGLDHARRPVLMDFTNPLTPHLLIAGTTGSGKTNAVALLTFLLATQNKPKQVQLILLDTEKFGRNWRPFSNLPHLLHPIVTDREEAGRVLAWGLAEIDRRAQRPEPGPHLFFVIDEAQALLVKEPFPKYIGHLARKGREFGVHLLAVVHKPTREQLGSPDIKVDLSTRLVGRVDDATSAFVATGQKQTGAELLTSAGDMLFVKPGGVTRLFMALAPKDTSDLPRVDRVRRLELAQYEDIDHVIAQTKRLPDPVDPGHVAFALVDTNASQRSLVEQLSIGFPKAKRLKTFAHVLQQELLRLGYGICQLEGIQ